MQTKLTHITLDCSRCGDGKAVAWAIPVDFYERQTWAGSRLVCARCSDELRRGAAWEQTTRRPAVTPGVSDHTAVKRAVERATVELFLPLYNARTGRNFHLVRMDERPDAVLQAEDGSLLGVEVTVAGYPYNKGEHSSGARNEVAFLLGRLPASGSEVQTFPRLIGELNAGLARKAAKYATALRAYPVVLLIRSASPLWSASEFEEARADIRVPPSSFREVWLLTLADDGSGWTHLMRLDGDHT